MDEIKALTLLWQHRYREAEAETLKGYEIVLKQKDPDAGWIQDAGETLASIYDGLKEPEKAKPFRPLLAEKWPC